MAIPQLGSENLSVQTILCDVYMGINSIEPLSISGDGASAAAATSWAISKLADVGIRDTILGCPKNALSPSPNANATNPPGIVIQNTANNVYYKTYFTDVPTSPQCSHTS